MKYIELPTDKPDHEGFYDREDHYYGRRPDHPIGTLYDLNSGREIVVEFDGSSGPLAGRLKIKPQTKGKVKRGVADKSFREVSPNGELEPNLAYTIKQAAEFLQLSEDLVLKMCKNRRLKSSQHENAYRIKGSFLLDYLEGK